VFSSDKSSRRATRLSATTSSERLRSDAITSQPTCVSSFADRSSDVTRVRCDSGLATSSGHAQSVEGEV